MKETFFLNKYLIFLLSFFSPMIISIGGEVSPSFLFILVTIPFWSKYIKLSRNSVQYKIALSIFLIAVVQMLWAPFANTTMFMQFKAILITTSGLIVFLFYSIVFKDNIKLIKWHVSGAFVASFVFVNVLAEIQGEEFGYWKFQVYPRIVSLVLMLYLFLCNKKMIEKSAPMFFFLVGVLGLLTGARSSSLGVLFASIFSFLLQRSKKVSLSRVKYIVISGVLCLYGFYVLFYVPRVLDGKVDAGNSSQLVVVRNPYNPLNLIMMGRTDAIVPFIAFLDNPITGWGWMSSDPNGKYNKLFYQLRENVGLTNFDVDQNRTEKNYIRGHSVIGYYICSYGIVVLLLFIYLISSFFVPFYKSLVFRDEYMIYRLVLVSNIMWNLMFSPCSHLKFGIPCSIAILLALSLNVLQKRLDKI